MKHHYDFVIIGGGIIGMSTAFQLLKRHPNTRLLLLEKESHPARHQTGRNSGVIHAGVYYQPGSLKAKFCKLGNAATTEFCDQHGIAYNRCGKLLVATDERELERMNALEKRCEENQIEIERLGETDLRLAEPKVKGLGALFVPSTGIVDYSKITEKLAELVRSAGGEIRYAHEVKRITEVADNVRVQTSEGDFDTAFMVACAGLHSDRIVSMLGLTPSFRILPFKGEYFRLDSRYNDAFNHLIYPIPDPELPFLGVHLTKMIDGSVTVGPNAVLATGREAYRKTDIDLPELMKMAMYPGLYRLLKKHFRSSLDELRNSFSKTGYLKLVHKYCPDIQLGELQSYPAGIRAQAVRPDGSMVDDFLFEQSARALVVCNAPSPAATSAFPIGEHIVDIVEQQLSTL